MVRVVNIPKFQLEEMYVEQGLSSRDIARMLGISRSTVLRLLDKYGIPKRNPCKTVRKYDKYAGEWGKLYEQGFSLHEIAKKYGVSAMTVSSVLIRGGFKMRSVAEGTRIAQRKRSKKPSRSVLVKMYVDGCRTAEEIARVYGVSGSTVRNWLRSYGISLRRGGFHEGHIPWNKGLTKETDERVRRYAIKQSIMKRGKHYSPRTEFKREHVPWNKGKEIHYNRVRVDLRPSPTLSYILGVMLGDGTIVFDEENRKYGVRLDNKDLSFVKEFGNALKSIGFNPFFGKQTDYRWSSPRIIHYVGAYSKNFAEWYRSLTLKDVETMARIYPKEFLRGFYRSEGGHQVDKRGCSKLNIHNSNLELLELVRKILSSIGFYSGIHKGHNAYYLDIHGGKEKHIEFLKQIDSVNISRCAGLMV